MGSIAVFAPRPNEVERLAGVLSSAISTVLEFQELARRPIVAQIEHQNYLADEEKRRREEDQRRIEKSIKDSQEHLSQIIKKWSEVLSVEGFLRGVTRVQMPCKAVSGIRCKND
jgi:hypothetical protein